MSGRRPPHYKEAEYDAAAKPPAVPTRQATPRQVQPRYRTPTFIPSGKEQEYASGSSSSPVNTPPRPTSPLARRHTSSMSSITTSPSILDRPGATRRSDGSIVAPGAVAVPGMTRLERQQYILPPPGAMAVIPAGVAAYQRQRQDALSHILNDHDDNCSDDYITGDSIIDDDDSVTIMVNGETDDIIADDGSQEQEQYDDENVERIIVGSGAVSGGGGGGGNRNRGRGRRRRSRFSDYTTITQAEIVDDQDNLNTSRMMDPPTSSNLNDSSMTTSIEEDIEARVQARLQEETQNITDRVRQQIIQEASHATVVVPQRENIHDNSSHDIEGGTSGAPAVVNLTRTTSATGGATTATRTTASSSTPTRAAPTCTASAGSSSQYTSSSANSTTTATASRRTTDETKRRRFPFCCCCCCFRPLFCFLVLGSLLILAGIGVGVTFSTKIQEKIENTEFPTLPWFKNTVDSDSDDGRDCDGDGIGNEDGLSDLSPTPSPTFTMKPTLTMMPTSSVTRYDVLHKRIGDALLSLAENRIGDDAADDDDDGFQAERNDQVSPRSSTAAASLWEFSMDGIVALEWLANHDPAKLDARNTPIEILLERFAIVVLFEATGGNDGQWIFSYSFLSYLSVCDWNLQHLSRGIFCNNDEKKVTDIVLSESNLRGSIPSEIACLTKLTRLRLDNNVLFGSIPSAAYNDKTNLILGLPQLTDLEVLDLHNNALSGVVFADKENDTPMSFFQSLSNLRTIYLHGNRDLSGIIPSTIHYATNLINLSLMGCSFGGILPQTIGKLSNLEFLQLHDNMFSGTIPSSIVELSKLSFISSGQNHFNGTIPEFGSREQPNLYMIGLSLNQLTGNIPASTASLSKLETLSLHTNALEGSIPDNLGSLSLLESLRLHSNSLTGTLPDFGQNPNLETIEIGENLLSGTFDDILNLHLPPNLKVLDISSNPLFGGTLPNELGKQVSHLKELRASNCQISGTIISEIGLITGLQVLDLSMNDLRGNLPFVLSELKELQMINLSDNYLSGALMAEIANLKELKELNVANNNFSGVIPDALTSLADHLDKLLLSGNDFVGNLTNTFCTTSEDFSIMRTIPDFQADCLASDIDNGIPCDCCTKCCSIVNNGATGENGALEAVCKSNYVVDEEIEIGDGDFGNNDGDAATVVELLDSP